MSVPTAEEIYLKITGCLLFTNDKPDIKKAMIEFAKLHLKAQEEAIIQNVKTKVISEWEVIVDKDSILNSYRIENIK